MIAEPPARANAWRARSEQRRRPAPAQRAQLIRASAPTSRRLVRIACFPPSGRATGWSPQPANANRDGETAGALGLSCGGCGVRKRLQRSGGRASAWQGGTRWPLGTRTEATVDEPSREDARMQAIDRMLDSAFPIDVDRSARASVPPESTRRVASRRPASMRPRGNGPTLTICDAVL